MEHEARCERPGLHRIDDHRRRRDHASWIRSIVEISRMKNPEREARRKIRSIAYGSQRVRDDHKGLKFRHVQVPDGFGSEHET